MTNQSYLVSRQSLSIDGNWNIHFLETIMRNKNIRHHFTNFYFLK